MKAYWVVRGHILNPEEYAKYINLAGPVVKKYQGTFYLEAEDKKKKKVLDMKELFLLSLIVLKKHYFVTTLMNTKKRLNMSKTLQID